MAKTDTVNIKSEDGFTTINKSDFNPSRDELFLKDGEIIVKPLAVTGADPFVIDEKDFDANSYERVNATKKNLGIVAEQTDRQTLTEAVAEDSKTTRPTSSGAGEVTSAKPDTKAPSARQTPQTQLKRAQNNKK